MTSDDKQKEWAFLQYQLGYISEEKSNLSRALSRCEQYLEIQLIYLPMDDPDYIGQ
jgi:hypothetical protein